MYPQKISPHLGQSGVATACAFGVQTRTYLESLRGTVLPREEVLSGARFLSRLKYENGTVHTNFDFITKES